MLVQMSSHGFAAAATAQQGALSNGDSVDITGTGFGTRSPTVEAYSRADLASVADNAEVPAVALNGWRSETADTIGAVTKVNTENRVTGERVFQSTIVAPSIPYEETLYFDTGAAIDPGTKIFVSAWAKLDPLSPATSSSYGQWKWLRLSNTESIVDHNGEMVFFNWHDSNQHSVHLASEQYTDSTIYAGTGNNSHKFDDTYRRMDVLVETSSYGVADGKYDTIGWYPGGGTAKAALGGSSNNYSTPDNILLYDGSSDRWRHIIFQNYIGNSQIPTPDSTDLGETGGDTYMSDIVIYVGTWKRVELTDNATYANSGISEVQEITSWSDTSTTIDFYAGSLAGTGDAWLHVLDEDDLRSPTVLATMAVTA